MSKKYKKVISRYKLNLFRKNHVVGVGYGIKEKKRKKTGEEAIVVLVDKKLPPGKLGRNDFVPMSIRRCQTDVQEIGEIQLLNRTEKIRPAKPGVSIGHYKISAGTLGAVVKDKKNGQLLILSNNHVLANRTSGRDDRSSKGDPILQPGAADGGSSPDDIIGHLERFIPIRTDYEESTCPVAKSMERLTNNLLHILRPDYNFKLYKNEIRKNSGGNLVDCAVAKPIKPGAVSNKIINIGYVNGIKEPELNMVVKKSGRTSGLTRGKIKTINTTVQVRMSKTEVATFEEQFITEPMSKAGDSGSLILDKKNNAVGLLFAGSNKATVCNHINNVMEELAIEF